MPRMHHLALIALLLAFAPLAAAEPPPQYPFAPLDLAMQRAGQEQRRLLLYIGTRNCGLDDRANRQVLSEPEVRRRLSEHYVLVYLEPGGAGQYTLADGRRYSEPDLVERFRATGAPVFAFLESRGRLIVSHAGRIDPDRLLALDDYVHGGHYRRQSFEAYLTEPRDR